MSQKITAADQVVMLVCHDGEWYWHDGRGEGEDGRPTPEAALADWRANPIGMSPAPPRHHRGLNPANSARTDQILAALDDEGALPISTSALLDKLGLRGYQNTVLRLLNRLARRGEVEKIKLEDMRCSYWRRCQNARKEGP